MKHRHLLLGIFFIFQLAVIATPSLEGASARISATLVEGSKNGAEVDPQIRKYARLLKGPQNFTSLKVVGQSSANIALPGSQTINLGNGHNLTIEATAAGSNQIDLRAVWRKGKQKQQETIFRKTSRNQPRFLGAGNYSIIVVVK